MTVLNQVVASSATKAGEFGETFKSILIFCGIGLLVSLLVAQAYGLDLNPTFF